jgi:hypothetical protein
MTEGLKGLKATVLPRSAEEDKEGEEMVWRASRVSY